MPSGKQSSEEALFEWIVSDFGLNDAIESGLVKTPRVVIRDDGQYGADYKSTPVPHLQRPRREGRPEPQGRGAGATAGPGHQRLLLAGKDWQETAKKWRAGRAPTPPVMITVANRTETAARVKYAFDRGRIRIDELRCPERTLHIDSKVLEKAESQVDAAQVDGQERLGRAGRGALGTRAEADQGPAGRTAAADGGHGGAPRASPAGRSRTSSRSACCPRAGMPRP